MNGMNPWRDLFSSLCPFVLYVYTCYLYRRRSHLLEVATCLDDARTVYGGVLIDSSRERVAAICVLRSHIFLCGVLELNTTLRLMSDELRRYVRC